jgi:hypothetical protein
MEIRFLSWRCSRTIAPTATGDVCLTTDDWLYAPTLHRIVKRDGAKHIAVIRHGACCHAQFFGSFSERLDLNGAVQEAVVGVQMKVCESLFRHKCNERAAVWA